ncbi:MAG: signal peptidase II [Deltaproteobacteria bacterium]|nr:signal peptidase II [Deltaproteobacteria bacterium]
MTTYEPEFEALHEDAKEGPKLKAYTHFVWKNRLVFFLVFIALGVGFDQCTKVWAQKTLAVFADEARYVRDDIDLDDGSELSLSEKPASRIRVSVNPESDTAGICNKTRIPLARDAEAGGYVIKDGVITLQGDCKVTNPTVDDVTLIAIYKVKGFRHQNTVVIIPKAFNFKYAENRAAAFSLTSSLPLAIRRPLLVAVAAFAMLLLIGWYFTLKKPDGILMTAFLCIVSGAVGNFLDRLRLGYVIDFIDWRASFINEKWPPWPTFNIADMFIVAGATLVILRTLWPLYPEDGNEDTSEKTDTEA